MEQAAGEAMPAGEDWNPVERVILERRSVRLYKDRQVPEDVVRRVIEAGRFAPSAGNCQPWKLVVVRDRETIDAMEKHVRTLCRFFRFFIDWRTSPLGRVSWLISQVMIRVMPNLLNPIPFGALCLVAEGKLSVFHGAPTLIFVHMDRRGASNPQVDVGCCGQNMVLAAHSMGLGTCWVGFVELLKWWPRWTKLLGVRFPYRICEGIVLGYPVGNPDGMIPREVMGVDWVEGGVKKTVY